MKNSSLRILNKSNTITRALKNFIAPACCISIILIQINSCKKDEHAILEIFQKGKKEYVSRNLDKAAEFFKQTLDEGKDFLPAYIMLGKSYFFLGRFEESEAILQKGLSKFPGNSTLHFWIARIHMLQEGKSTDAKRELESILETEESFFDAHYYLAKIYEKEGMLKEALLEYNRAKMIKIGFEKIHRDLGKLYEVAGLPEKAAIEKSLSNEQMK